MSWTFDDSNGRYVAAKASRWHDEGVPFEYVFERVGNGNAEVWINLSSGELKHGDCEAFGSFNDVCEYVGEMEPT